MVDVHKVEWGYKQQVSRVPRGIHVNRNGQNVFATLKQPRINWKWRFQTSLRNNPEERGSHLRYFATEAWNHTYYVKFIRYISECHSVTILEWHVPHRTCTHIIYLHTKHHKSGSDSSVKMVIESKAKIWISHSCLVSHSPSNCARFVSVSPQPGISHRLNRSVQSIT
jgi:hypothetical protein